MGRPNIVASACGDATTKLGAADLFRRSSGYGRRERSKETDKTDEKSEYMHPEFILGYAAVAHPKVTQDIRALQERALQAEEAQRRAEEENQALKAQVNRRTGPDANEDEGRGAKLSTSEKAAWKKRAKVAGSRAAALYEPFLDTEPLAGHRVQIHIEEILDDVRRAQESDPELDEEINPAIYWKSDHFSTPDSLAVARDMIYHISKSPGRLWLEAWFQAKIHEGARKQRSAIVHKVIAHSDKIFGIPGDIFEDRSKRPNLPQVVDLQNFLHLNEKNDDGTPDLGSFFRDKIIVRVLRLMLLGESAITTGKRSAKARKSYSKLWHITHITPSLLAYAATIIQFVFSGDTYFEEGSGSINYSTWFHARLRLLEAVYERNYDAYNDLMKYYNKQVLGIDQRDAEADDQGGIQNIPDEHAGMDAMDLDFLEQLNNPDE